MSDLRHLLAIYVHAHQAGNAVPPHIDADARAALAAEPPAPADPSDFQTLQGIALDMVESLRPIVIPEILGVLRKAIEQPPAPAPASGGEREELAALINQIALAWEPDACLLGNMTASQLARAAALLRQPAPAPVPVAAAERPQERQSWCDMQGKCWLAGLPHWAIPQPPQGGEVVQ